MVTKKQAEEFIRLMRQAIFSADSQVDDFAEPVARMLNVITGEISGDDDIHLDCGFADGTDASQQE